MIEEGLIHNPLLAALAITLIHFLWQGVLIAVVLKALLSLISYQKPKLRYALSSMAMLANLILPIITFFLIYDTDFRQVTNFVHAQPLMDQNFHLKKTIVNTWYMGWLEYFPLVTMVWFTVVATLALKLIIELYNVNKLPLQGCTSVDILLQKRFDALLVKVGLSKKVALLLSNKTDVPMAIGWLKPVVLIPFSMVLGLTPQQLDMLLLHELAHIRRHDYLVNFLQTLVEILLFFHPAVNWVSKQMRNEREYCSDDIAVQHGGSSLAYAHTLADTASLCQQHRHHTIPNMAMAATGGDLKQRVVRLLDQQRHCTKTTDTGKWLASFTILLSITFLLSKYSLTLPTIDLQSGNISLYNSVTVQNKSPIMPTLETFEPTSANTTLASHLLVKDHLSTSALPVQKKVAHLTQSINKKQKSNEIITKNKLDVLNDNATNFYYNELPFVRVNSSNKKNVAQHHAELKHQTQVNQRPELVAKKSNSTLAFKRTDTTFVEAEATTYTQQIDALLNEPILPRSTPITVLNKSQYGISYQQQTPNKFNSTRLSHSQLNNSALEPNALKTSTVAAQLLNSAEPRYPALANRQGIELDIKVEFTIDINGLVKDIQFESKSKVNYFRNNIRNAMEKWRFLPAKKNGQAVRSTMSKIFSFSLLE